MKIGYVLGAYSQQFGCNYFFQKKVEGKGGPLLLSNPGLGRGEMTFDSRNEALEYRDNRNLGEDWKVFPVVTEEGLGR